MESVPDWSALLAELLETIARSFTVMEDFMAFRGVCTSWRAAATKDVFVSVSKVPLLMLAQKEGTDEREFYSLAKRKICTRIPLPDIMGKRCIDVGFGWILIKELSGEVCLMKPFSSAKFPLPNFKEFPDYRKHKYNPEDLFIVRAWLTANPSETSKFTLFVTGFMYLGFWNNGDESWGKIESLTLFFMTYWKGKTYVLDLKQKNLLIWDFQEYFSKSNINGLVVPIKNGPTYMTSDWHHYLVGSSDGNKLYLIRRNDTGLGDYALTGSNSFRVMELDLAAGEFLEIKDLGNDALFLGDNALVCVDAAEFPGILKSNCIYFTDDCYEAYDNDVVWTKGGGKDMGIYNVKDESVERFDVDSPLSHTCPPMWIFPSFSDLSSAAKLV